MVALMLGLGTEVVVVVPGMAAVALLLVLLVAAAVAALVNRCLTCSNLNRISTPLLTCSATVKPFGMA
jgi:hypothetical protein